MRTRQVMVRGRAVTPNGETTLVRTSVGIDLLHVYFDNAEWLDFASVQAVFANGETRIEVGLTPTAVESTEIAAEAECVIPWEVMQDVGDIELTFQATDSTTGEHIITERNDGILSVVQEGVVDPSTLPSPDPTPPDLPIATTTTAGAVIPDGETITIDEDGVISSVGGGSYTLPPATTSTLGGVKPDGTTITVTSDGTITASGGGGGGGGGYVLPTASTSQLGGVKIDGDTIDIDANGVISAYIPTNVSELTNDSGYITTVPTASASTLGGVKVGTGLAIDANGVLSTTGASVTAITDSEIDTITGGTGYANGDGVSY